MTKTNTIKKLAAGLLALALVAGAAPANVGGFLTQGSTIVAAAKNFIVSEASNKVGSTIKSGDSFHSIVSYNASGLYGEAFKIINNTNNETIYSPDYNGISGLRIFDWIADKDYIIKSVNNNHIKVMQGYDDCEVDEYTIYVEETVTKTSINIATVNVDTANGSVTVTNGNDTIDAVNYTVEYIKKGESFGNSTFPTEAGKYTAKVTATGDSYEGSVTSAEFIINGKLQDGFNFVYANINDTGYVRYVYVLDRTDLIGKSSAKFRLRPDSANEESFAVKTYYSAMTFDGIRYTPEVSGKIMFVLTLRNVDENDIPDGDFILS